MPSAEVPVGGGRRNVRYGAISVVVGRDVFDTARWSGKGHLDVGLGDRLGRCGYALLPGEDFVGYIFHELC